ncbi:ribosomal RNA small subunit methyltransferase I [Arenicella chitinivorans]|uniref:Ribosomal RNA small subunit methyltransferase I n=1 Tax=Arenicella chitinivorans TaxID=1329800 RepID=A0A918RR93_9GAMM|nr:16S rRNA (cytidine(1402)-2'-O)-methyltransferase [Arenicella chitinivorans]GHA05778.1 ribosomal RNA small subunit methyltransferase I [Arenicella chitinivorans]
MNDPISKVSGSNSSQNTVDLGCLQVVATPIGNLADISQRALDVLRSADLILAEDTRHSKRLLAHFGINTPLRSCHEHNERELTNWVQAQLTAGQQLALISDAGTPLISDPGFVLVRALRDSGHQVVTVPGPSSIIAALSIAGLPTDRFVFDGFLPPKAQARQTSLRAYLREPRTAVLLESSHRIVAAVRDIVAVLGDSRRIVLARELTKRFETVLAGTAAEVLATLESDSDQTRGEFVLMLAGVVIKGEDDAQVSRMLDVMLAELPVKQAAALVAKLTGRRKNDVYQLALSLKS